MNSTVEPIRIWRFSVEDENGDHEDITPEGPLFIGLSAAALSRAEALADEYESKTGALVLKVWFESQGKA